MAARYPSKARRGPALFKAGDKVKVLYSSDERLAFADKLTKTADLIERRGEKTDYSGQLRRQANAIRKKLLQKNVYKVTQSGNKMVGIDVSGVEVVLPIKKKVKSKTVHMIVKA
ncbi:hypothetical protein HN803_06565 [candidate division WWE3 bacterium]|jgi:hypothetical protein|nr:hypothetical protein [candidate division WWE3 bacterium]MBT7350419.1 hypothetical protein [candidate division WWE3 bacterium]